MLMLMRYKYQCFDGTAASFPFKNELVSGVDAGHTIIVENTLTFWRQFGAFHYERYAREKVPSSAIDRSFIFRAKARCSHIRAHAAQRYS